MKSDDEFSKNEKIILNVIKNQLGISEIKTSDKIIDDLHADSLDIIEILMELEDIFEVDAIDEDCLKLITVKDVINYTNSLVLLAK